MKYWRVQVEATTDEEAARGLAKALREQGHATSVSRIVKDGQAWYRVRVGKYEAQEDAVAAIARFRRDGHFSQAYLVQE
jgi:cell division protein FtsN